MILWIEKMRRWCRGEPQYFALDPAKMRPGDLILSTEFALVSLAVRTLTNSDFSHASIYLGDGLYAESTSNGVRAFLVTKIEKVRLKVMRLEDASGGAQAGRAAADRINDYLNSPYNFKGVLCSLVAYAPSDDPHFLFCSQLVAQAYKDAGVEIVPDHAPGKVTPALLADSELFEDITASARVPASGTPHGEPLADREAAAVERMYQALCPFFDRNGIAVPRDWFGMLRFLANLPDNALHEELDVLIMNAMTDSGYIDLIRAIQEEVIKPLARRFDEVDPSGMPEEVLQRERFKLGIGLEACQRQAAIDLENVRICGRNKDRGKTFFALLEFFTRQYRQRNEAIRLIELTLVVLGASVDDWGVIAIDQNPGRGSA